MSQAATVAEEPLTTLAETAGAAELRRFAGARTPAVFASSTDELRALVTGAGVYDLGWLQRFRITGEDRARWLNGMVTNTVRDLAPGRVNYTFLLNAQGRIQGDGDVYALPDALLFATDRAQALRLHEHLERFIIMDDVELAPEQNMTAIGVAGPDAGRALDAAGLIAPAAGECVEAGGALLAQTRPGVYTVWIASADAPAWWEKLTGAGATPCGVEAVEALRVLSGVPRYGADIHDKTLAQETGQTRALNFSKGCYLGQEIVERIRSRATVHRSLRAFRVEGAVPRPGASLFTQGKPDAPVGELTSITPVQLPELSGVYALGTVRTEVAEAPLLFDGGTATALPRAPLQTA